jgi:hypothetical protein
MTQGTWWILFMPMPKLKNKCKYICNHQVVYIQPGKDINVLIGWGTLIEIALLLIMITIEMLAWIMVRIEEKSPVGTDTHI